MLALPSPPALPASNRWLLRYCSAFAADPTSMEATTLGLACPVWNSAKYQEARLRRVAEQPWVCGKILGTHCGEWPADLMVLEVRCGLLPLKVPPRRTGVWACNASASTPQPCTQLASPRPPFLKAPLGPHPHPPSLMPPRNAPPSGAGSLSPTSQAPTTFVDDKGMTPPPASHFTSRSSCSPSPPPAPPAPLP